MDKQLPLERAGFEAKTLTIQKKLFEFAATLGAFCTHGDAVQEEAIAIVQNYSTILASGKDRELFLNALTDPAGPNKKLQDIAKRYKKFIKENE